MQGVSCRFPSWSWSTAAQRQRLLLSSPRGPCSRPAPTAGSPGHLERDPGGKPVLLQGCARNERSLGPVSQVIQCSSVYLGIQDALSYVFLMVLYLNRARERWTPARKRIIEKRFQEEYMKYQLELPGLRELPLKRCRTDLLKNGLRACILVVQFVQRSACMQILVASHTF